MTDLLYDVPSAILGIVALLLGLTSSLSLQRFDSCSEAVDEEARAAPQQTARWASTWRAEPDAGPSE